MWNEKLASIRLPAHGCQHQKMLRHTASRSAGWWTQSLTFLPQETIPPGHGWGILARVTEGGVQVQLLAQNPSPNQQDSASRGCHASPFTSTHGTGEKQSPGKCSLFLKIRSWTERKAPKKALQQGSSLDGMGGPNYLVVFSHTWPFYCRGYTELCLKWYQERGR